MTDQPPDTLAAISMTWAWNTQAPPPGNGQVRTDSRDWAGATLLCIDYRNDAGGDVSVDLAALKPGDAMRLEHNTDPTRWVRFDVLAAPTRVVDHFQIPVGYNAGAGTVPNSGTRIKVTTYQASGPVGDVVSLTFQEQPPWVWLGKAACKHGTVSSTSYRAPTAAIDYAGMVTSAWRQQDLLNMCNCPNAAATDNAVLNVQLPLTLQAGERRVLFQTTATLTGTNFVFGPLTCQKSGAYAISGQVQLANSVAQGAVGRLSVVVGAVQTYYFPLMDIAAKATATMSGVINMRRNESVMLVFDNFSSSSQTLQSVAFKIGAVWVP